MKLRALEPEDLDLLYSIENDGEQWDTSSVNVPYSRYVLNDYLVNQSNDIFADKQVRLVIEGDDGMAVGLIDLFNFSPEHSRAEIGLALLRSQRGRGYARLAIEKLRQYARDIIHLHQIVAVIDEGNVASLKMLQDTGFTFIAKLPDWLRKPSGWADAVMMQLTINNDTNG